MRPALGLVVLVAALGCADPDPIVAFDPDDPLPGLPECEPPARAAGTVPEGLVAPPGTIVVGEPTVTGPLVQVSGYVAMTPVQVRAAYEARDDIDVLHSEDEVYESELLVSDRRFRTFVRARAVCAEGSALELVVAPEVDADELPVPGG